MEQKLSILLTVMILLCSLYCTPQASAVSGFIGEVKDPSTLPAWADQATLRRIVKNEYKRMTKLKSTVDNGVSYFDYGQTTDDWMYTYQLIIAGSDEIKDQSYMIQVFTGGTSSCSCEGWGNGISAIVVTEESYKKGKAYTVRDAFAQYFLLASTSSSTSDMPCGQQYWIGDKVYQLFYYGHIECDYSVLVSNPDYMYFEDACSFPTTGTEERYAYAHKGDVDEDSGITVADVVALRQYIVNPDEATATQNVIMDMDGDFAVTVTDVVALRQKIVNG